MESFRVVRLGSMPASYFVCAVKESQKNMSEIIQNMSDIFQNRSDIIFFFSQWSALIFELSEMTGIR